MTGDSGTAASRRWVVILLLLASIVPIDGTASEDLERSLRYLDAPVPGQIVVEAGYGLGLFGGFLATIGSTAVWGPLVGLVGGTITGICLTDGVHRLPIGLAAVRRSRSLGSASDLVGRAVLRLRIEPSLERAASFAATDDPDHTAGHSDPLSRDLGAFIQRSRGTPQSGLAAFGAAWAAWFPALERATMLLRTAATAPPERRDRSLDRALGIVIDGTRDQLASFVGRVHGPITALYSFCVLLPLALAGLLPAAHATGFPVTTGVMVGVYNVLLPTCLVAGSAWLLVHRPVAFPPPSVTAAHPAVPNTRRGPVGVALLVGGVLVLIVGVLAPRLTSFGRLPLWAVIVLVSGCGIGAGLLAFARPRRVVHERVRAVEETLPDAMTLVGGRIADGVSVETAVREVGETLECAAGDRFAEAARRGDVLRIGIEDAFNGPDGALATLPSRRARNAASLLAVAASEGQPAGDVVLDLADQLERLDQLERDARRDLARITGTLTNTAAVFGPIVGGATVALAAGMDPSGAGLGVDGVSQTGGFAGMETAKGAGTATETATETEHEIPFSVSTLGLSIGVYVLVLAVVLTTLATALERGFDPTVLAHRIGIALPTATVTYVLSFVGASLVV